MTPEKEFDRRVKENVRRLGEDKDFRGLSNVWVREAIRHSYAQNFTWLGRPIIQVPQDVYAIQELIWAVRPDLVIETGVAHGGSLILSASLLALLDYCDAVAAGEPLVPCDSQRRVLGIDIDIRAHNRAAIASHPMAHLIELVQGSSIEPTIVSAVKRRAADFNRVLVFLDSNHTHEHVLAELEAYAPLVGMDSYCVVWDSGVEDLPDGFVTDRPWGKGNNPKTALLAYLGALDRDGRLAADGSPLHFEIDKEIEYRIMITASTDGFLKRRPTAQCAFVS
ncbi:CmcI family methyltransferase [uncultured Thiodictyon sp.]|uniref:cephalosporin hydroxylase family protein n=1 Tax=uncultured Thiodictyon sp. TaxID=1846217 RepID=UPI0025EC495D|nr:CmcI family methyltransferase [uncultured Thiodictyon sp.]